MFIRYHSLIPIIPYDVVFKKTAGITTTTLSTKDGVNLREVDYRALQDSLIKQGVPLPGVYATLS